MVKINITLNQSSINNAIKQLKEIKQQIETKKDIIAKEVAEQGKDYIITRYNQLPFQKTNPDPKFYVEKTSAGYRIVGEGKGIAFDEYGTGVNATKPHIGTSSTFIKSGYNYWYLPKDVANQYNNGKRGTSGHASGHFMYDGSVWIKNNYKRIAKENMVNNK